MAAGCHTLSKGPLHADLFVNENILHLLSPSYSITGSTAMLRWSGAEKALPNPSQQDDVENLQQQLAFPHVKVSFFSLFRHATRNEVVIIAISTVLALAAGAIVPLPPVLILVLTIDVPS